ncbi:lectin-like domain-containing protein [Liquorilactobacillus mali]|uniref:MucBP domain-containing protein n=1 Tax=Liquorilactobacillus mali KCTC 3596 = DSM 20444 TaxID=1046596 RepID=J1F3H2_9LACO|nr:hypothetical protein [Liquorilactobacillus mali]EJE99862.1 hypothetical protein LMA_04791 [Liquorilactobacillus mali KCTC 3596 = DSM 20444]KRN10333.1 hypothetical protein FD00_GL000280 [Liquorilactobacillus mali KCTC 3596 = DSM 20444]MDC7953389.1 hypothetical protein [Liquorilactobacillus mali]QFQ75515.1 hypothetical protein LM596_10590 [Liquorilactobacillus mali]
MRKKARIIRKKNTLVLTSLVTGALISVPITSNINAATPEISTEETNPAADQSNTDAYTTISKDDFLNYFTQNGNAVNNYDSSTGIQVFTTTTSQAGNITFKGLINLNNSFEIKGAINVGKSTAANKVADGIGFAFYQGDRSQYSSSNNIYGGNVGIYGVPSVFGWKLDTYANYGGVDGDSDEGLPTPYGAFVSTDSTGRGTIDQQSVQGMGSDFEDGQLHDLDIKYDSATKILSVVLDNTTFSESLASKINSQNPQYSFSIAASTGAFSAEQTFRFDYMKYVASQNATINYIDENTGKILDSSSISGNSNSIIKYPDAKIEDYKNEGYEIDTTKTDLTSSSRFDVDDTKDQTFSVYLKHKTTKTNTEKTVQQKISYEYEDGEKVAADSIQKLVFTNEVIKDEVTGETTSTWTPENGTTFGEVVSPEIKGYTADQATIPETDNISQDSSDTDYVVKYSPKDEQIIIRFIDSSTGNVILEKQLNGKFGTTSSYKLTDDIALIENQGYFVKSSTLPTDGIEFAQDGQPTVYEVNLLPIEINPNPVPVPDSSSESNSETSSDSSSESNSESSSESSSESNSETSSESDQKVYPQVPMMSDIDGLDETDEDEVSSVEKQQIEDETVSYVYFINQDTGKIVKADILPKQDGFYPINVVASTMQKYGYQLQNNWNGIYNNSDGNQKDIKVYVSKKTKFQNFVKPAIEDYYTQGSNYSFRDNMSQSHNALLNQFFSSSSSAVDVNHTLIPKVGGGGAGTGHEVAKILAVLAYSVNFSRR